MPQLAIAKVVVIGVLVIRALCVVIAYAVGIIGSSALLALVILVIDAINMGVSLFFDSITLPVSASIKI